MKKNLVIIGASGHGKVVADIAIKMEQWESIFFLDDNTNIKSSIGLKVIGKVDDYRKYIDDCEIFVAIGHNKIRQVIQEEIEEAGATIPVLIHPSAIIGTDVVLHSGTTVMAGAVINCSTKIGKSCIINTGATVDHDNVIEDYVHVSPGVNIAGNVKIGKGTWVGIGSVVSNNLNITKECTVGAGAVVVRDIDEPGIYIGAPVKKIGSMKINA
ncbi:acetyltransferase [Salipaludibacillus daqingensis]|uniref:acetyltransferase n=1 Tax=Salipaludibacillus daqingensis TaxID=3041001 RepID=UPI0024745B3F|nr:acetyltransferase [Salipaludibacillus daqingensis]